MVNRKKNNLKHIDRETLEKITRESLSMSEVLRKLNVTAKGTNYADLRRLYIDHNIDFSNLSLAKANKASDAGYKNCTKCRRDLPETEFNWRNKNKNLRANFCRHCKTIYQRRYYINNKSTIHDKYIEIRRVKTKENHRFLKELLEKSECVDCGYNNPMALEFDHRDPKLKTYEIGKILHKSIDLIKLELDKCDVVCANCHNIRTIRQQNSWRWKIWGKP